MKPIFKILLLTFALTAIFVQCEKKVPIVRITDDNFLNALIELGIDTDGDGQISNAEAEVVSSLDVSGTYETPGLITDMIGIEKFVNLDTLRCGYNQLIVLDVSNLTALNTLVCSHNLLSSVDVSANTALTHLFCTENQ